MRLVPVQEYADKAFSMSLDVQQKNVESHHMRVTNSIVLQVVDRNDSLYLGKVCTRRVEWPGRTPTFAALDPPRLPREAQAVFGSVKVGQR